MLLPRGHTASSPGEAWAGMCPVSSVSIRWSVMLLSGSLVALVAAIIRPCTPEVPIAGSLLVGALTLGRLIGGMVFAILAVVN